MNIRDHSSQFCIYVYSTNLDIGASTKVHLSQAGYDAFFFQDQETLFQRLSENPPHVLVFATEGLSGSLSEFVSYVRSVNDEIKFIVVASVAQFDVLARYNNHGLVDVISSEPLALEARLVWSVDRACEKIYLTYQNEQLFDDLQVAKLQVSKLREKEAHDVLPPGPSFPMRITEYRSSSTKEDVIQKYLNNIGNARCIFFKFLPSVRSFVATHSPAMLSASIQGVGVQLEAEDIKELGSRLALGLLPESFSEMLGAAFNFRPPKALPLYAHNVLEGVFVYSGTLSAPEVKTLSEEFTLMSLCYANFVLEKKVDALEVQDHVTELFNRNYFYRVIDDEVSRARRLKQPLSVVKIAMDDFYKIESSLGEVTRDELFKSLATIVAKTSRTNDVTCRTAANEIAVILPHCSKKGAVLLAERLRRIVEGTSFIDNGMKLSISLGISEYPTLCDSAKTLDETASKALMYISDKGGNKICLYKASEGHKPDYEVPVD